MIERSAFIAAYGSIYEHSPWVAERAFERGARPGPGEAIHAIMKEVVDMASEEDKLALLRAHPDLAVASLAPQTLTASSKSEQAGAGLACCTPEELDTFIELNRRYKGKFGFPFIIAVKGLQRADILANFRQRIENDRDTEFERAVTEVHKIALARLRALQSTAS